MAKAASAGTNDAKTGTTRDGSGFGGDGDTGQRTQTAGKVTGLACGTGTHPADALRRHQKDDPKASDSKKTAATAPSAAP